MTDTPARGGEPVDVTEATSGSSLADLPLFAAPMSPVLAGGGAAPVDDVERPERAATAGQRRLFGEIDWALVRAFRQQVADRLAKEVERRDGLSEQAQRELGRALITEALREHTGAMLTGGREVFGPDQETRLAGAMFDAMFGLGRLQPLVDDPDVENIEITGCDDVWLQYADGRLERGPAVAESDEDLIADLQFLAAHGGNGERPFSAAHPTLDLQLHDGSRLAAMAWTASRPTPSTRTRPTVSPRW
jgi:hypothetical protein